MSSTARDPRSEIKANKYLSIALGVLEKAQQERRGLHRPTPLSIGMARLGLGCASNPTTEAAERDGLLVSQDIFQIPLRLHQLQLLDGLCCFASVL